jgi:hypothetical protein
MAGTNTTAVNVGLRFSPEPAFRRWINAVGALPFAPRLRFSPDIGVAVDRFVSEVAALYAVR